MDEEVDESSRCHGLEDRCALTIIDIGGKQSFKFQILAVAAQGFECGTC
jgi:hypothetical protein